VTDDLKNLLHIADASASLPDALPPTESQLRSRWSHRRRRQTAIVATASALLVAATVALWPKSAHVEIASPAHIEPASDPVDIENVRIELAQLDSEAQTALAVARGIAAARRSETSLGDLPDTPNFTEIALAQSDRAAMIGVAHADRLREALSDAGPAVELYQHIADLFPQSRWSEVARQRIKSTTEMN
jgi:hypothetical protein